MTTTAPRRLRKERVQMVMEAALAAAEKRGGRVRTDPFTGETVIDFPAIAATLDDEEAARMEANIKAAMGAHRFPPMPKITDRPRYYVTRQRGGAYWAPGKWVREFGFLACAPLGPDGPEAKKKAIDLNDALDAARIAARRGFCGLVGKP